MLLAKLSCGSFLFPLKGSSSFLLLLFSFYSDGVFVLRGTHKKSLGSACVCACAPRRLLRSLCGSGWPAGWRGGGVYCALTLTPGLFFLEGEAAADCRGGRKEGGGASREKREGGGGGDNQLLLFFPFPPAFGGGATVSRRWKKKKEKKKNVLRCLEGKKEGRKAAICEWRGKREKRTFGTLFLLLL